MLITAILLSVYVIGMFVTSYVYGRLNPFDDYNNPDHVGFVMFWPFAVPIYYIGTFFYYLFRAPAGLFIHVMNRGQQDTLKKRQQKRAQEALALRLDNEFEAVNND